MSRKKMSGPQAKAPTQDIRIRSMPTQLVYRLKSVLALRGQTLGDWFLIVAAKTADEERK
jgi:hypothetical protein